MLGPLLAATVVALGAGPPTAAPATQRAVGALKLNLSKAVSQSLSTSAELRGATAAKAAEIARRKSVRGNFGPLLRFEFGLQIWDSELTASLGDLPIPGIDVPPLSIRDQTTWNLSVSLIQPLTAMWTVYESYELTKLGVDVAELKKRVKVQNRAWKTAEAYLRVKQAEALMRVAANSIKQRQAQEARVRALESAGVIKRQDLLRAQLGVSSAKQNLAAAKRQRYLASAQLALFIGVPPSANLALEPLPPEWETARLNVPEPMASDAARKVALNQRIELLEVEQRLLQASGNVQVAKSKMLPEVSFIASFLTAGGQELQGSEQFFVGLNLSWNAFDWGATYYQIDVARAGRVQAQAGLDQLREGIGLEVEAARTTMIGARDQLLLARKVIAVAEENFKLQQTRYEQKAATTFDVIEAETQLTKARIDVEMASFEYLVAWAALRRAMGTSPSALLGTKSPATTTGKPQ